MQIPTEVYRSLRQLRLRLLVRRDEKLINKCVG